MPIGDRAREEVILSSSEKQLFRRILIDITEKPISDVTFDTFMYNENLRFTNGTYELIFRPITKQKVNSWNKPFLIRSDIFKNTSKIRVPSYKALLNIAEVNPEVAWLVKWTTISEEMFECAKIHRMMPLAFTMKYTDYCKFLKKQDKKAPMQLTKEEWVLGEEFRAERRASKR